MKYKIISKSEKLEADCKKFVKDSITDGKSIGKLGNQNIFYMPNPIGNYNKTVVEFITKAAKELGYDVYWGL